MLWVRVGLHKSYRSALSEECHLEQTTHVSGFWGSNGGQSRPMQDACIRLSAAGHLLPLVAAASASWSTQMVSLRPPLLPVHSVMMYPDVPSVYFKGQTYTHTLSEVKLLVFGEVTNEFNVLVDICSHISCVVGACGTT